MFALDIIMMMIIIRLIIMIIRMGNEKTTTATYVYKNTATNKNATSTLVPLPVGGEDILVERWQCWCINSW